MLSGRLRGFALALRGGVTLRPKLSMALAPERFQREIRLASKLRHPHLLSVLEQYRALGWRVALDDVGIGWSSLALVSSVRPDVVKLGRELVTRLAEPGPNAVARALTESAHAQGAVVVAEGVEDEPMADQARAIGADLGQGWWFGRPARPQPDAEPELTTV